MLSQMGVARGTGRFALCCTNHQLPNDTDKLLFSKLGKWQPYNTAQPIGREFEDHRQHRPAGL